MNSILFKEPVKRAEKALKEFDDNLYIECLEKTARTANDAATALSCKVGAIVKSLLFRTQSSFFLCLVSGDKKCSLNKLKKILGEKDISMANADQVKEIPNQNTNTLQNGTVFLDPSNTGGSSNDNKVVPKYPANDGNDTNTNKIVSNEPAKNKPDPENSKQPSGNKPYANPVPGKVGHVYSPFANGREVDVTGFPPGTEVRCPYTKMIFRVP